MPTDTQVNDLKINILTEAQYEQIQSPSSTELYLVPEIVDTTPTSGSANPITSGGVYNALQNIPSQEQSDWSETDTTDPAYIKNKPSLATVATSGSYNDLTDKPTIPDEVVWVTFEADSLVDGQYTANMTPTEIYEYINSGACVLGIYGETLLNNNGKETIFYCTNYIIGPSKPIVVLSMTFSSLSGRTNYQIVYDSLSTTWKRSNQSFGDSNVQSDWSQTDTTADDYIKNKPQNIVTDANYVHTDNNYTTTEKNKLAGIASGAEVNVQSDWNQSDSTADDYIKNKPDLASYVSGPSVATEDNIAVYDGTTGKLVKDANISVVRLFEDVEYLDNTTSNHYYIARTTGKWAGSTSNAHRILDLTNIRKVTITARSNREAQYTFLKSYTVPDSEDVGETPDYADGYTTAVQIAAGTTQSLTVPADANYLYILVSTSYTYTPTSLMITGIGITEHSGTGSGFIKDDGSVDSTSYQPALPSYLNNEGKVLAVNSDATGLEWITPSDSDTDYTIVCSSTQGTSAKQGTAKTWNSNVGWYYIILEYGNNVTATLSVNGEETAYPIYNCGANTSYGAYSNNISSGKHLVYFDGAKFNFTGAGFGGGGYTLVSNSSEGVRNKAFGSSVPQTINIGIHPVYNTNANTYTGNYTQFRVQDNELLRPYINGEQASTSSALANGIIAGMHYPYYDGTNWWFRNDGKLTAGGYAVPNGTSSQFLKSDGSVDSTSYEPSLPSKTSNAGKVLSVNSGATGYEWVKPVKIYSGASAPSSSTGSDGDIYIQTIV